jgi:type IV pilus biogenesis protein CpaD/CtpE
MNIMGDFNGTALTIHIYPSEIWIDVYETEIPIVINRKTKDVYVDCETSNHQLTSSMLDELSSIVKVIEDNIDEFLGCLIA